jgi:hypothetical protein
MQLTRAQREDLGLALYLLKQFKTGGKIDETVAVQTILLAKELGVIAELEAVNSNPPPRPQS